MFGQVLGLTLEEIHRFGREEVVEPILELSTVVQRNSAQIVGERAEEVEIRWGKVRRVEESPSRVPEWPLSSCLECLVGRCHAEDSLHVVDPGVLAGFLPPDDEVVDNSVQQ
jgi:hypothetical protein